MFFLEPGQYHHQLTNVSLLFNHFQTLYWWFGKMQNCFCYKYDHEFVSVIWLEYFPVIWSWICFCYMIGVFSCYMTFLSVRLLSVLRGHSFFHPRHTVNDLRLRKISISDRIHYIIFFSLLFYDIEFVYRYDIWKWSYLTLSPGLVIFCLSLRTFAHKLTVKSYKNVTNWSQAWTPE